MKRWRRITTRRSRRGGAAVEFAFTFPVMVLILLGVMEFGFYFGRLHAVNNATRDAARFGANQPSSAFAMARAEEAAALLLADLGFDCGTCGATATMVPGIVDMLVLEVNVPYVQLTGVAPRSDIMGFRAPRTLRARIAMPVVGP